MKELDIDFIRYSLSDESIENFIKMLNCIDGISIIRVGRIEELSQQDYKGKRVNVHIKDNYGNLIESKIDLGVHKHMEIVSTRYKDIYDMYYQCEKMNEEKLIGCLRTFIFDDSGMREKDMGDILRRLEFVFRDKTYKNRVDKSDKRWLDNGIDEVFGGIVDYLNKFI